jgi:hypothetical protein
VALQRSIGAVPCGSAEAKVRREKMEMIVYRMLNFVYELLLQRISDLEVVTGQRIKLVEEKRKNAQYGFEARRCRSR